MSGSGIPEVRGSFLAQDACQTSRAQSCGAKVQLPIQRISRAGRSEECVFNYMDGLPGGQLPGPQTAGFTYPVPATAADASPEENPAVRKIAGAKGVRRIAVSADEDFDRVVVEKWRRHLSCTYVPWKRAAVTRLKSRLGAERSSYL